MHSLIASIGNAEILFAVSLAGVVLTWTVVRWVFPRETNTWRHHDGDPEDLL